ncbi:MAG TPA: sigma-70 family RNA polymerase sigma factor, partial [Longimicrobiales bacterium]|nr:sigma-70 family RNA polymerase sigma factor [Longimicrobiales bacterium]
ANRHGRGMTDVELIERARAGDGLAMRRLHDRHCGRVFAVVRRLAGEDALAEDWAQEAWVRIFRALPTFRGDSRFTTWIHRVAVNCALQGRRRRERREDRETDLPDFLPGPVGGREHVFLRVRLDRAIERLPERMRQVLVLHDVEGYTHDEIGELLGIHPGTSKSQLFKARARMRQLLRPAHAEMIAQGAACHT